MNRLPKIASNIGEGQSTGTLPKGKGSPHVDKQEGSLRRKILSTCGKVVLSRLSEHFYTETGDIRGITGIRLLGFRGFPRLEKVVHSGERRNRDTPTREGKR